MGQKPRRHPSRCVCRANLWSVFIRGKGTLYSHLALVCDKCGRSATVIHNGGCEVGLAIMHYRPASKGRK
jgi:hypothetical protein